MQKNLLEKIKHYFSNEKLNSLALELRAFAEEQAKEDGILYWKILEIILSIFIYVYKFCIIS